MSEGRIYYAEKEANYYLKFVGDVRVTLCASLSSYIDHIFCCPKPDSIVVDLREAKAVDSTTLGFMAKVAIYANKQGIVPLLISSDPSMIRLVEGMGFDEIFQIVPEFPESSNALQEMDFTSASTDETRDKVIEAHQVLMSMNTKNMDTFSELVNALQKESERAC